MNHLGIEVPSVGISHDLARNSTIEGGAPPEGHSVGLELFGGADLASRADPIDVVVIGRDAAMNQIKEE